MNSLGLTAFLFLALGMESTAQNCTTLVKNCMGITATAHPCDDLSDSLRCLSGVDDICPVPKTGVTFEDIIPIIKDGCEISVAIAPTLTICEPLSKCLQKGFQGDDQDGQTNSTLPKEPDFEAMASPEVWCRYGTANFRCMVDNADVCSLPANITQASKNQLSRMQAACNKSGAPVLATVSALGLLVAAVLALVISWAATPGTPYP